MGTAEQMRLDGGRKLYILANQILPTGKQKDWEQMPSRRFWGLFSAASRPDPSERELGILMDHFMGDISRENRMILLRRYWYMDTVSEIAIRYGISEAKVRSRLRRTQGRLYTYLEQQGICL